MLRTTLGAVFVEGPGAGAIIAALRANANLAVCEDFPRFDEESRKWFETVECTYVIASEDGFAEVTSTAQLVSSFGLLGVLVDPVILQVPDTAIGVSAAFKERGRDWRALETTVTDRFHAAPGQLVSAEPGNQFLILELPADVVERLPQSDPRLGTSIEFDLRFGVTAAASLEVKPMFALAVESGGTTYYPPMLPCVTDFGLVPSFVIPFAEDGRMRNLMPEIVAARHEASRLACDGQVWDFTASEDPPPGNGENPTSIIIDVKPGGDPNAVNPRSQGLIPVAVLTTSSAGGDVRDFDATSLDMSSLRFGPAQAPEAHGRGHRQDVDGDGDLDLIVHFATSDTGIRCGDAEVELTGRTSDGADVRGADTIVTPDCR